MSDAVVSLLSRIIPARTQEQPGTDRGIREENIRGGKPRQVVTHRRQARRAWVGSELDNIKEVKRDEAEIRTPENGRFMRKQQMGLGIIEHMDGFNPSGLSDVDII